MTLQRIARTIANVLDGPGRRWLLAAIATRYARSVHGPDAEIVYEDNMWLHRWRGHYAFDGERFSSFRSSIAAWDERTALAADFWYHWYTPKPGDVVVDAGAGIGDDTALFAETVGPEGRVVAIEAHPGTFRSLVEVCKRNRLTQVFPLNCAIMGRPGLVRITGEPGMQTNAVVTDPGVAVGSPVPALTLDELCDRLDIADIDLLKMNIEGAERDAIRGMTRTIERTRNVCIACHDFRGEEFRTRDVIVEFLRAHGFEVSTRPDDPREYVRDHVYGTRRRNGERAPRDRGPDGDSRPASS